MGKKHKEINNSGQCGGYVVLEKHFKLLSSVAFSYLTKDVKENVTFITRYLLYFEKCVSH